MEPTDSATIAEFTTPVAPEAKPSAQALVDELLIEEISIDGMCGVY